MVLLRKLNCLIVDDDPLAHVVLKSHIEKTNDLVFANSEYNGQAAVDRIISGHYDVVFLDVTMPQLTGLEVLERLSHPPAIVIVSAIESHAFRSFQLNCADYILKPVTYERFCIAVGKAKAYLEHFGKTLADSQKFAVSDTEEIDLSSIRYIQALGNYVKVYVAGRHVPHVIYESLKSVQQKLAFLPFMQIHKSYVVNRDLIEHKLKTSVRIKGGEELPVGRRYEILFDDAFFKLL